MIRTAPNFHPHTTIVRGDNFIRENLLILLNFGVFKLASDKALDGEYGI